MADGRYDPDHRYPDSQPQSSDPRIAQIQSVSHAAFALSLKPEYHNLPWKLLRHPDDERATITAHRLGGAYVRLSVATISVVGHDGDNDDNVT